MRGAAARGLLAWLLLLGLGTARAEGDPRSPLPALARTSLFRPPLTLGHDASGSKGFWNREKTQLVLNRAEFRGLTPLYLGSPFFALASLEYTLTSLEFSSAREIGDQTLLLHSLRPLLILGWSFSQDLRLVFSGGIRIAGDYESMNAQGISPILSLSASHVLAPRLSLLYGLSVSRTYYGLIPVPLLGLSWQPAHSRFIIDIFIPRQGGIAYLLSDSARLRLSTGITSGDWYSEEGSPAFRRLQMLKLRARLSYLQRLGGMLWLDLHVGVDYFTSLRGLDEHDRSLFQIFQKPAPTAGLSLVLMPTRH